MKNNRKTVNERQTRILDAVNKKGELTIDEIAQLSAVSPMTVRRDLQALDAAGLLKRMHGRAVSIVRKGSQQDQDILHCRACISKYAAGFIKDGDTVFINGSRTALDVLHYTGRKRLNVYTNNGWALYDDFSNHVRINLIGGELYGKIMVGEYVIQNLLNISADKTLIGCAAVYDDGEFRYDIPTEIGINEMMSSRTHGPIYIVADHSKLIRRETRINTYGSFRYNYDITLLTDSKADPEILDVLRSEGIPVISVPVD